MYVYKEYICCLKFTTKQTVEILSFLVANDVDDGIMVLITCCFSSNIYILQQQHR